jgi:hypothetical protein
VTAADTGPSSPLAWLRALWRSAGWGERSLFLAVALLFAFRATFYRGRPGGDRTGFHVIAAGVLDGHPDRNPGRNTYPPTFSVAMVPVELARRSVGDLPVRMVWGLGQLAALVYLSFACASLFARHLGLGGLALVWVAGWRFVVSDLNNQNVSLFLAAMVAAALLAFDRGRETRAGALLGVGTLLKVWPGAALIALVFAPALRRARAVRGFVAAIAIGGAVTAVALGPAGLVEAIRFWIHDIVPRVGGPALLNQSFRGLCYRLLVPGVDIRATTTAPLGPLADRARLVSMGLGLALFVSVCAVLFFRRARDGRERALDGFLLTVAVMPALPIVWVHYAVTTLPLMMAVAAVATDPTPTLLGMRRWAIALAAAGSILACLLDVDLVGVRAWRAAAFFGNALAGVLLLLSAGLMVRAIWRVGARAVPVRSTET